MSGNNRVINGLLPADIKHQWIEHYNNLLNTYNSNPTKQKYDDLITIHDFIRDNYSTVIDKPKDPPTGGTKRRRRKTHRRR